MTVSAPIGRPLLCIHATMYLFLFALTSSCTTIESSELEGSVHYYVGLVKFEVPKTDKRVSAVKNESLGVGVGEGVYLGWISNEYVSVPIIQSADGTGRMSAACSVLIIVRSENETKFLEETLLPLEGENVCLIPFEE